MKRFPGSKWLNEATYISDAAKDKVRASVARAATDPSLGKVSVRPPSYTGEPHPVAIVSTGGFIFEAVYA